MKKLFATAIVAAIVFGAATVVLGTLATSRVEARPSCKCPMVYDPVVCSDGQVYSNACVARCEGARGCTSTGGGPIQ